MNSNHGNKIIAVNTMLLTVRMVFVMAIGLYSTRIVLQVLGASDYGIYNVVGGFVSMFAFINTSMSNGIQRFYNFALGENDGRSLSKVFSTAVRIQVIIAFAILFLIETVGIWYLKEKMVIPIERQEAALYCFQFSTMTMFISVFQLPYIALVMARERMNFYAIVSIIDAVLKLIIVVVLPYIAVDQLIIYGFLLMLISVVDFFLYFIYVKREFPNDVILVKSDKVLFKEMISFSGWNCFGSFGVVMCNQGLNLILNFFFGTVVNAARGIAFQVAGACKSFVFNITTASRPQMTQSYAEGNVNRSISIMESMSKMCFVSLFVLALPIVIELDFILEIWLGDSIPNYTKIFTMLVVAESLISVFNPPISFMVHATGKMKRYQLITTCVSLTSLPIAFVFLKFGMEPYSVFAVSIFFTILCQIVSVLILRSLISFPIRKYFNHVVLPMIYVVIASVLLPYIFHRLLQEGWWRLIVVSVASCISLLVSSYLLGLNTSERTILVELVKKRISE